MDSLALTFDLWIPLFTDNAEVFDAAKKYIQIVGPAYLLFGLGLSLYFASQGTGAMQWPIAATVVRFVVAVGGALVLAFTFNLGLSGVFFAAAAAMVIYSLMIVNTLKMALGAHSYPRLTRRPLPGTPDQSV
ncbi:MAG: Na+-driven multidrug efflux pump [Candidatus Azotimanducaceae bacterium]